MLKDTIANIKQRYITLTMDELSEIIKRVSNERLTTLHETATMTEMLFTDEMEAAAEDVASQILIDVEEELFTFKNARISLKDIELPEVVAKANRNTAAGLYKYETFISAVLYKLNEAGVNVDLQYHSDGADLQLYIPTSWLTD